MSNLVYIGRVIPGRRGNYGPAIDLAFRTVRKLPGMYEHSESKTKDFLIRPNLVLRHAPDGCYVKLNVAALSKRLGIDQKKLANWLSYELSYDKYGKDNKDAADQIVVGGLVRWKEKMICRSQEDEILADLDKGEAVMLLGMWGTGKSNLRWSLIARYGEKRSINVTCAYLGELSFSEIKAKFNEWLVLEIKRHLRFSEWWELQPQEIAEIKRNPIKFINDYYAKQGEKVLLALEEPEYRQQPQMLEYIASIKNYSNINLLVVLHPSLEIDWNDFFAEFKRYVIRPLNIQETSALIDRYTAGANISFSKAAKARILSITGGSPYAVAGIMKILLDPKSNIQKVLKLFYTASDINSLMDEISGVYKRIGNDFDTSEKRFEAILSLSYAEIDSNIAVLNENFMRACILAGNKGRELLTKLTAEGDLGKDLVLSSYDERLVQYLIDMGLVGYSTKSDKYYINAELLSAFIKAVFLPK